MPLQLVEICSQIKFDLHVIQPYLIKELKRFDYLHGCRLHSGCYHATACHPWILHRRYLQRYKHQNETIMFYAFVRLLTAVILLRKCRYLLHLD